MGEVVRIDEELRKLLPPLSTVEREALAESIKAEHVRDPILIAEDGTILDGHHRHEIAVEHNRSFQTIIVDGLSEAQRKAFVLASNFRRRNLSPDQKAELRKQQIQIAGELKEEGRSQAEIALALGVARNTISDWIRPNVEPDKRSNDNRVKLSEDQKSEAHDRVEAGEPQEQIAADLGVSQRQVGRVHKAVAKKKEHEAEVERQKEEIAAGAVVESGRTYPVIVIDPPWPYPRGYDAEGHRSDCPYPTMELDEIAGLKLPADDDCILWLWTTHLYMRHSFLLLDRWGFAEKVIVTWVKNRMGTGRWLRSQSEFCIMAVKGKPKVHLTNQTTVLHGPMREHSRKPDEFYEMVEGLCFDPDFVRVCKENDHDFALDFFSREKRLGWAQMGNDPEKFEAVA